MQLTVAQGSVLQVSEEDRLPLSRQDFEGKFNWTRNGVGQTIQHMPSSSTTDTLCAPLTKWCVARPSSPMLTWQLAELQWRPMMKIIAYDRFKPGVTMETIKPYIQEEVANVWRLWKAGIVRENYARADVPGVVIVFECGGLEEAKRYVEDF